MKPYKILSMIKVFGHDLLYTDLTSFIILADPDKRFVMKVMKPEKTSKKLRLRTVLDDLGWQKCTLAENKEIAQMFANNLLSEQRVECRDTGIVLPHPEGDLCVLQTLDKQILLVNKEYLDSFNWYEMYAGENVVVGHAKGGSFCLKLFKGDLTSETKETIALLNNGR